MQDEAIPSSRHVREEKYRNETRERHNPLGGLPKTKEKILTAQGRRSGEDKLLLPVALTEKHTEPQTHKGYRGERVGDGLSPVVGDPFGL